MNKSTQIRAYLGKHPKASVNQVVAALKVSRPMVYKLRSRIQSESAWQPPAILPVPPVPVSVDNTLLNRAGDYGTFKEGAALMQGIKRQLAAHAEKHNRTFADDQWEAIEMIVHKLARIVNGNPDKIDSWVDIAGYATLVAERLQGNAR
jgi:hypothetical protein